MNISLIAALAKNRVIGSQNDLPWRISEDLQFFKRVTLGKPVIMGRKTFDSIGKPLPKRRNIVITRNRDLSIAGAEVVHSLELALNLAAHENPEEIMVIGGGELYSQALLKANRLYLTYIDQDFEGDVRFPEIPESEWQEVSRDDQISKTGLKFSWVVLERIS
jgi:dihydrofolate reductase